MKVRSLYLISEVGIEAPTQAHRKHKFTQSLSSLSISEATDDYNKLELTFGAVSSFFNFYRQQPPINL